MEFMSNICGNQQLTTCFVKIDFFQIKLTTMSKLPTLPLLVLSLYHTGIFQCFEQILVSRLSSVVLSF